MTILGRPLGNRIAGALSLGLLWTLVTGGAAALLSLLTGGVVALVDLIAAWIGVGDAEVPWELMRTIGEVLSPFVVAAGTWAATFGSTERLIVARALVGTVAGVATLILFYRLEPAVATASAFGVAWSVAVTFDTWIRMGTRLGVLVVVVAAGWIWLGGASRWELAGCLAAGPVAAALAVLLGDALGTRFGRPPERRRRVG